MEILDVFDGNHVHLGTAERGEVHDRGLWHQTFHCWVVNERDGKRNLVVQQRSATASSNAGKLHVTGAGHLRAGEQPTEAGLRELAEEIGVVAHARDLVYLGVRHDVEDFPDGRENREFAHVYLLRDDRDLTRYRFTDGEVTALVEIELAAALDLFTGQASEVAGTEVRLLGGVMHTRRRVVTAEHFATRPDPYCATVTIMAQLLLDGATHLSI